MHFDSLQEAILDKDPDAVVAVLANWTEEDRASAGEPFNILAMALGFERLLVLPCSLKADSSVVVKKRKRDEIQRMSSRDGNFDYEMQYVAWLARYGIETQAGCQRVRAAPQYERHSAQVMADRRPPWLQDWYQYCAHSESSRLTAYFWTLLYQHQLVSIDDFNVMAETFACELPSAFETAPDETQKVLREIEPCRELIYEVAKAAYQLFYGKQWVPLIEWISQEGLLDRSRLLKALVDALHTPLNQTERNGAIIIAKAVHADVDTLALLQPQWLGLLADSQSSVAGFALDQLHKLEKSGKLDAREATVALPSIFAHKPKTHAKHAVEMLGRIAGDKSLRSGAVTAVASALMHPNKDVQKAALDVLVNHLQPDDAEAIAAIELNAASIAATLKPRAEALLNFEGSGKTSKATRNASSKKRASQTTAKESEAPVTAGVSLAVDISRYEQTANSISETIRRRLRVAPALQAAGVGQVDQQCRWGTRDMRVLLSAQPITPIESVEELVDVTSAAVEKCDCPDTADRILSGITRLYRERPDSFESMTKPLAKRACAHFMERPMRGIVGGFLGTPFSLLISAWLGVPPEDDYDFLTGPIQKYLIEIEQRVKAGTACPLLSEATHSGGWIDPQVWVARLSKTQQQKLDLMESDLLRSCLRLAPDGRGEALKQAVSLDAPLKSIACAALGGDVKIDDSWSPPVWIAALCARDAWIDLSNQLSDGEQGVITDEIAKLPDVVYPSDYRWKVKESTTAPRRRGLVQSSPMQDGDDEAMEPDNVIAQLLGGQEITDDLIGQLGQLAGTGDRLQAGGGFFTAQLHRLPCHPAPAWTYPYLASQWPMKLNWYWNLASIGLSRRVESKSSVDEPYGQYLLPLLEQDRPLTPMAARALWIATVSKDDVARSIAIEVWISLAAEDRCDVSVVIETLVEVSAGGWVKLNRIGEFVSEVAAVSALHAWVLASVLEGYLLTLESFPKDVAKLLEPLDECCEQLGRAVATELAQRLESIKTGKARPLAKSLCARVDAPTRARQEAITAAIQARLERAQRFDS